jgi:TIR domain
MKQWPEDRLRRAKFGDRMLTTSDRVGLILRVADRMKSDYDWDRIGFILSSFGIAVSENDPLEHDLSAASNEQLIEIARMLSLDVPAGSPPASVSTTVRGARPLYIFASHLSSQRGFLGAVRTELEYYGVTLFVAHDSIPDDATWQSEIEKALDAADAGLVFLHPKFKESDWCPQEVGWLLGRHVPVIPLNFGVTPFGPLGKLQAGPEGSAVPQLITEKILDRLLKQESLRGGLVSSLVAAMGQSPSFNRTDRIWKYLRELDCDADQSAALLAATKANDQIYRANSALDSASYPRAIIQYLRRQPEAGVIKADIDAYEQFLIDEEQAAEHAARRVREAREASATGDPFA